MVNEFQNRGVMTDATNPLWQTGADIIKYYNMDGAKVGDDCWTLLGYACAWFLLYYVVVLNTTGKR